LLKKIILPPDGNCFPKANRLLTKYDYQDVFRKGKRIYSHTFCLFYRENLDKGSRLGIVVGKKKVAKAVKRNVLKRLVREFFRLSKNDLSDMDIVVLVNRKPNPEQTTQQFRQELKTLWLKLPHGPKKF
jgi:ribonuclease P protein component